MNRGSINFHVPTPSQQSLSHIFWPQGKTLIFTTEYQLPAGNVENVLKIFYQGTSQFP